MAKVSWTSQELVIFSLDVINKQIEEGYITKKFLPQIDTSIDPIRLKELMKKIETTGQIPHQDQVMNMTRSFFEKDEDFTEYFQELISNLDKDKSLKGHQEDPLTKTAKERFKVVKNLVTEGKEVEALAFKQDTMMNERHYHEAVEAGRKARKNAQR